MKIITQLVILTLSLLLVSADDDHYCDNLYQNFRDKCNPSMLTIKSCCELVKIFLIDYVPSGVYKMSKGSFDNSVEAYCDMITDSGGWIVIQRNKKDSSVNFNKNWTDYEEGFGDLNKEFWYGLKELHCLTQRGQWEMRMDYQKNDKTWSYLHYNQFSVGSASEEYPLTFGGFTGVGTDQFTSKNNNGNLNGTKFSTPDNDNDKWRSSNCAARYDTGWWYNDCYWININMQPPRGNNGNDRYLFAEMKIRPKNCIIQ